MSNPQELDALAVILAGGTGTRLWPVSDSDKPKQFHHFFGERTLLQGTYDRLSAWMKPERIMVLTQKRFVNQVKKDLPNLPDENIIGEPHSRDTGAALTYAALLGQQRFGDPVMMILPSDHLITPIKDFRETLLSAVEGARKNACIYTLGVKPDRPETSYGYLHCGKEKGRENGIEHYELLGFKEKPDQHTAQQYISSGEYYWNCGIFISQCSVLAGEIKKHLPEHWKGLAPWVQGNGLGQEGLEKSFASLPSISIDYGVMEKAKHLRMVPARFTWSDLGHWPAIEQFLEKDLQGNSQRGKLVAEKSQNNMIFCESETERVALLGVQDVLVIRAGKDTLLVHRSQLPELKSFVEKRFK